MVSNNRPRAVVSVRRNQAMIRIGGEQGRAAVLSCFQPGITARGLFRKEAQP